ncbi:MAG: hypothetical protein ACT4OE_03535 [Sphingosinicella sp.]
MIRVIFGALVAAVAMFVVGFIFFGPVGLSTIATGTVTDLQAAAVQQSLAANLPRTGTYLIPSAESSAAQTVMYGQGPIATVHYNLGGFPAMDTTTMAMGLVFNFLVALVIGAALIGIDRRVPDFRSRSRVAMLIAVAASAFNHLGEPIYWHHDWPHFIYTFIADSAALAVAGLILAWSLPASRSAPADAPKEV